MTENNGLQCAETHVEAEKRAAKKLAEIKTFDDGKELHCKDNIGINCLHIPSPMIDYNPKIVYPFVGVYILLGQNEEVMQH